MVMLGRDKVLASAIGNCNTESSSDSKVKLGQSKWQHFSIPSDYTSANHPVRFLACSPSTKQIAVFGSSGFCLLNRVLGKWRKFGNVVHEAAVGFVSSAAWFGEHIVCILVPESNTAQPVATTESPFTPTTALSVEAAFPSVFGQHSQAPSSTPQEAVPSLFSSSRLLSFLPFFSAEGTENFVSNMPSNPGVRQTHRNKLLFFPRNHLSAKSVLHTHVFESSAPVTAVYVVEDLLVVSLVSGLCILYCLSATVSIDGNSRKYSWNDQEKLAPNNVLKLGLQVLCCLNTGVAAVSTALNTPGQTVAQLLQLHFLLRSPPDGQTAKLSPSNLVSPVQLLESSDEFQFRLLERFKACTFALDAFILVSSCESNSTEGQSVGTLLFYCAVQPQDLPLNNSRSKLIGKLICRDVERIWTQVLVPRHPLTYDPMFRLCVYANSELQIWLGSSTVGSENFITVKRYVSESEIPLAISQRHGSVVSCGYVSLQLRPTSQAHSTSHLNFAQTPAFVYKVEHFPYLSSILLHVLTDEQKILGGDSPTSPAARGLEAQPSAESASLIAHLCKTQTFFHSSLEILLYSALAQNQEDSEQIAVGQFESFETKQAAVGAKLERVLSFLKTFPNFLEIVVAWARKNEALYWPQLFRLTGPPTALFEECLENSQFRTASLFLLLIQRTEGVAKARRLAFRLLNASVSHSSTDEPIGSEDVELTGEVTRFLDQTSGIQQDEQLLFLNCELRTSK